MRSENGEGKEVKPWPQSSGPPASRPATSRHGAKVSLYGPPLAHAVLLRWNRIPVGGQFWVVRILRSSIHAVSAMGSEEVEGVAAFDQFNRLILRELEWR